MRPRSAANFDNNIYTNNRQQQQQQTFNNYSTMPVVPQNPLGKQHVMSSKVRSSPAFSLLGHLHLSGRASNRPTRYCPMAQWKRSMPWWRDWQSQAMAGWEWIHDCVKLVWSLRVENWCCCLSDSWWNGEGWVGLGAPLVVACNVLCWQGPVGRVLQHPLPTVHGSAIRHQGALPGDISSAIRHLAAVTGVISSAIGHRGAVGSTWDRQGLVAMATKQHSSMHRNSIITDGKKF